MPAEATKFVTYQDIADKLGVTKMTVSKALRDSADISDAMKESVKKAADELGYIPNNLAKNLKNAKTNLVAVVFNSFQNPYFSIVCSMLFSEVEAVDYQAQLFFCDRNLLELADAKRLMMNKFSGIISCVEPTQEAIEFFRSKSVPFVLMGIRSALTGVDCVYTDDYLGGTLIGKYCAEHGYDKIMYASDSFSETSERRCRGFVDELAKHGKSAYIMACELNADMSALTVEKIRKEQFDFVFGFSDSFSILLLQLLGETSACIFGYDHLCKYMRIIDKINSVDCDLNSVTKTACRMLLDKIEGVVDFDEKLEKVLPVTLAVRE